MSPAPLATGEYQPKVWQIVTDEKGFESIHETDEDGLPGDLVAHVFGDNARLIASATEMFEYIESSAMNGCATAISLIAKARGEASA